MLHSTPLDDIAAAVAVLAASESPAAKRVGEALSDWARSRTLSFEAALGGAPGFRAAIHSRERDRAILRLARGFADLSERAVAEKVHATVSRFRSSPAWQQHRDHRPDGPQGDAWDALTFGAGKLLCPGSIRAIMAENSDRNLPIRSPP
jgi:hypothetical protein